MGEKTIMIWSMIYLTCVLVAQYTATWIIPLPIPIIGGAITVGLLFFGVTFTARDRVHGLGRKHVYTMIILAVIGSIAETIILGVPFRIIVASAIAITISETADTEVYQRLLNKSWFIRVISSNAISIPLDSLIFASIAFVGLLPNFILIKIIYTEIVIKYTVGLIVAIGRR
jgi:uncharacterized PurR-regulated membrane protein YhhQ (DUF165 family)